MEDKRDYDQELDKKDNLMQNDDDYEFMAKLTGFDEESIEHDRKKGLQTIIFAVVCVVMLVVGFVLGYNLPKKPNNESILVTEEIKAPNIAMAYTKKNNSGELYLYLKDDKKKEHAVLELSSYSAYHYNYYDKSLYVILVDDKMVLYKIDLTVNGYNTNRIREFVEEYDSNSIYFVNNTIYFVNEKQITTYDLTNDILKQMDEIDLTNVLAINNQYIVYDKENKTNLYNIDSKNITLIGDNILLAELIDNKLLYFKANDRRETILFYEYLIAQNTSTFISESSNSGLTLIDLGDNYLYNDGTKLFLYNGLENKEIYNFENVISEITYLNEEEIIIILDNYENTNCFNSEVEVGIFNIKNKQIKTKKISGCLDTKIINDVIFVN